MNQCIHCQRSTKQVKAGLNRSGSQRVKCNHCLKRYTPNQNLNGFSAEIRRQAIQMSIEGINQRRIARLLGVSQGSVSNWVIRAASELSPEPVKPETPVATAELDELFTFVGHKKTVVVSYGLTVSLNCIRE